MLPEDLINAGIVHSCYPNTGLNANNELITISCRLPDEQITLDFSTLLLGGKELMKCQCGFNGCRGSVRGFDHIPVIFQEKYLKAGVVPILKE